MAKAKIDNQKIVEHSFEQSIKCLELFVQSRHPKCSCDRVNLWQCDKCYIDIVINNLKHGQSALGAIKTNTPINIVDVLKEIQKQTIHASNDKKSVLSDQLSKAFMLIEKTIKAIS